MKIAAVGDPHCGSVGVGRRRADIADILLLRAVERINRLIRPDVTVILGDMLDDAAVEDAPGLRRRLRQITDILQSPTIILPGNHDGDVDVFYRDFERPPEAVDIGGVRFLPFIDPQDPEFNAHRTRRDIQRMLDSRAGHDGPIVALQHVPVFPPGMSASPYHYLNGGEVVEAMRAARIELAIRAHFHPGDELISDRGTHFAITPALCESPFAFLVITIDGSEVTATSHALAMPPELGLFDWHVHTQFAYCSADMTIPRAVGLARDFGLSGLAFTEHSGQLYFDDKSYWSGAYMNGLGGARPLDNRMPDYFAHAKSAAPGYARTGLEVDCDGLGAPVVRPDDLSQAEVVLGSIHLLPEFRRPQPDLNRAMDQYLGNLSRFVASGIHVLAHPFRLFRSLAWDVPTRILEPTAKLLKDHGVGVEINMHGDNEPSPEFFSMCIKMGVKLTFGSDAHSLYELGDFARHMHFLRDCGYDGDVRDVLLGPDDL